MDFIRAGLLVILGLICAGRLHAATSYTIANKPTQIAIGDLDNDGFVDIVTANQLNNTISILYNQPANPGQFLAPVNLPVIATPLSVAVGDLNNDGLLDIITGGSDIKARVFMQTSARTFNTATPTEYTVGTSVYSVAIGDLNGDTIPDFAAAFGLGNSVAVFYGAGNGTFNQTVPSIPVIGSPRSLAIANVNGDAINDIVVCGVNFNGFQVILGREGFFDDPYSVAVGAGSNFLRVGDFNGDSKVDVSVLLTPASGEVSIGTVLGNGDGSFGGVVPTPTFPGAVQFAVGDMTGDNNQDIVLATNVGATVPNVFGLRGQGDGTFVAATDFQFSVFGTAQAVGIADFNKDGQPDLCTALVSPGDDAVYVELFNPRATITSISPDSSIVLAGGASPPTLTLTGTNFKAGSQVKINGISRTTTYDAGTGQLHVTPAAADLAAPGRISITVVNPTPGGFASDAATFFVYASTTGVWTVTNTNDSGAGSLRFALSQCRSGDTIQFDPSVFDLTNSDAETVINVLSELPALDDGSVTIDAQNQRVTINGSGAGSACGIVITSSSNNVRGISLVGFSQSGVCVKNAAKSNTIGGSRKVGTGPNGQGLRISDCGAFGIEITGAGTDSNVVKGCWIGLDSGGTAAQSNLAGILVQGGSKTNVIGGTGVGEGNVISGNAFEGVTVSGAATDDNTIIGNIVGAAAVETLTAVSSRDLLPTRANVGNGSAGIFLSRGTQHGRVGGEISGEGNRVSFNGGNGIEVRSGNSERNSAKTNSISRNIRGGIKLFDGSNNGINPPVISSVTVSKSQNGVASSRAIFRARVQGSIDRAGTIEFFNDPADQGDVILGRATVPVGNFDVEIDIDDLLNLTATLTDADGNTSAFASSRGVAADSDDDGVLDALELLAGTNKDDASSVPGVQGALAADKIQIGLNFVTPAKDKLTATLRLVKPDAFTFPSATIGVLFAAHAESVTLDASGRSPKGNVSVKVKTSKTGPGVLLGVGIKNTPLQSDLSSSSLTNRTSLGDVVKLFIATTLKDSGGTSYVYTGTVDVTYKSAIGKAGKATKAK